MNKKITAVLLALAAGTALGLLPAISRADVLQDTVGGALTPIEVGKKIVAYNEEGQTVKLNSGAFAVECSEVTLTGRVAANPGGEASEVLGTVEDAWFRGSKEETKCANPSSGGTATITIPGLTNEGGAQHWCIRSVPVAHEFVLEPHKCGGAGESFTFIIHTAGITCGFERAANIKGIYLPEDVEGKPVTLTMNNGQEFKTDKVTGHSILCPATGKLENFKFQMYTDTATTGPTWREAESVKDPVFITRN